MPLYQVPVVHVPIPPVLFQRAIRPGEKSSFSVVSDWTTTSGTVHYEYEMRLETEKPSAPKVEFQVNAVMLNLFSAIDGQEKRIPKFGVVPFILEQKGIPKGMSGGPGTNQFVVPLLSLSIPTEVDPTGSFKIAQVHVDHFGDVYGAGKLLSIARSGIDAQIKLNMAGDLASSIEYKCTFRPMNGQLLRAEGTYTSSDGTLKFEIKRR